MAGSGLGGHNDDEERDAPMPAESLTDTTPAESVFRLIYRSESLIEPEQRSVELASIFTTARNNNRGLAITGALMVTDTAFVQALEGDENEVKALYESIEKDSRHEHVNLVEQTVAPRTFGRWAMAEVATDDRPDRRLVSNPSSGEIVKMGKDPSITPEQEQLFALMRDAARDGASH